MSNPTSFCNRCGLCNNVCPIYRAYRGREPFGPRFKVKLLSQKKKDKVFFLCTGCTGCEASCPNAVGMDFIGYRKELFSAGVVPASLMRLVDNMKEHRDPYHDDK